MFLMKMKIPTAVLSQIRKICPFGLAQLSFQISCHLVNNHLVEAESPLTSMPGFLESVYIST